MGLLSKLKSLLGVGDDRPARRGNVDVTVEHEPGGAAAESERAVKEPASESGADASVELEPTESETATETADADAEAAASTEPETAESEAAESEAAEPEQSGAAAESVDTIKGVGPSYAETLSQAGVETVGDLAEADADALGDETGLSSKRISGWIEQAEARTR